jgi:predicted nucleotide-binding protein
LSDDFDLLITAVEDRHFSARFNIFRPSENAIFELGAASALYGSRVVIFKETGVTFPTNFRDIGYIEFDKDRLDAKVNELFPGTNRVQVNHSIGRNECLSSEPIKSSR